MTSEIPDSFYRYVIEKFDDVKNIFDNPLDVLFAQDLLIDKARKHPDKIALAYEVLSPKENLIGFINRNRVPDKSPEPIAAHDQQQDVKGVNFLIQTTDGLHAENIKTHEKLDSANQQLRELTKAASNNSYALAENASSINNLTGQLSTSKAESREAQEQNKNYKKAKQEFDEERKGYNKQKNGYNEDINKKRDAFDKTITNIGVVATFLGIAVIIATGTAFVPLIAIVATAAAFSIPVATLLHRRFVIKPIEEKIKPVEAKISDVDKREKQFDEKAEDDPSFLSTPILNNSAATSIDLPFAIENTKSLFNNIAGIKDNSSSEKTTAETYAENYTRSETQKKAKTGTDRKLQL